MNLHLLLQKLSEMDFISELSEIQDITFIVFEPIKLAAKKKSLNFIILQPQTTHILSNRAGEEAFFEENENKMM